MLSISHLSKQFRGPQSTVSAIQDVSLTVNAGEFLAVQGPSGSGKTTLLLAIGGLERPDEGRITLDDRDPYALAPEERAAFRAANIGFVFQQYHLVPYLTVLENVLSPVVAHPRENAGERARELVQRFGLSERAHHLPAALSAGERQRAALARALFNQPRLILADEPTGNLDRDNAQIVIRHLLEFAKEGGTVILVTHDTQIAAQAQKIIRMKLGKIVAS